MSRRKMRFLINEVIIFFTKLAPVIQTKRVKIKSRRNFFKEIPSRFGEIAFVVRVRFSGLPAISAIANIPPYVQSFPLQHRHSVAEPSSVQQNLTLTLTLTSGVNPNPNPNPISNQ